MEINAEPKWLESLDNHAIKSLSLNSERIVSGSDEVLVSPTYTDIADESIFHALEGILQNCDLTDQLREIEDSNRSKFGPRSIAKPWEERKESLFAYFNHQDYDPGSFASEGNGRLRPLSVEAAAKNSIKSSSAGLPSMRRKGSVLDESIRDHADQVGVFPCVLFTRTQENGKTRNVWGYPFADTIEEQRFFMPWLELEKRLFFRSALLGPDEVDASVTKLIAAKTDAHSVMCVDFSSYDASITPEMSWGAFSFIASHFQSGFVSDLYRMYRRFVTVAVASPDGEVSGPHGVPSGSSWTNTVDSLVQWYAAGSPQWCQIQGDDGIYLVREGERESYEDRFRNAGLELNASKTITFDSSEALFLQRYYHPKYVGRHGLGGVYSLYRAMHRIKYLERWSNFEQMGISGGDFFALRTITILENCKHHPGFEALVRYAHSLDKFGLKFTREGLIGYSNSQLSRSRAGVLTATNLEKGINEFETVKLLRTL